MVRAVFCPYPCRGRITFHNGEPVVTWWGTAIFALFSGTNQKADTARRGVLLPSSILRFRPVPPTQASPMLVLTREAANHLRNQAEALAIGIEAEVLPVAVACTWAKERMEDAPAPVRAALEAVREVAEPIVSALRSIPGTCDRDVAEVLLVRRLIEARAVDPERANAMLAKLIASYRLHDPELREAASGFYAGRSQAQFRDREPIPLDVANAALVAAAERYVARTAAPSDPIWGWGLPSWASRP